jgi:hypothetical protein
VQAVHAIPDAARGGAVHVKPCRVETCRVKIPFHLNLTRAVFSLQPMKSSQLHTSDISKKPNLTPRSGAVLSLQALKNQHIGSWCTGKP